MSLDRRQFIRTAALAGMSLLTPVAIGGRAEATEDFVPYGGPFWLFLNAVGGWDTTMFCDPRGAEFSIPGGGPCNNYSQNEVVTYGSGDDAVSFAPGDYYGTFLDQYRDRVTLINGVDSETNGHVQGERVTWSGRLEAGYPSLAALVAAERAVSHGHPVPMPFLTFGGYDHTGDLVTPTRLANMDVFGKVAAPNQIRLDGERSFHHSGTQALLDERLTSRLAAKRSHPVLPRTRRAMDAMFTARLSERNVERVLTQLEPYLDEFNALDGSNVQLHRQCLLALTAFKAGVCYSTNLHLGGWDSHANNDTGQTNRFTQLFGALSALMGWAEQMGLTNQINVVVASDFGRTPFYNGGSGKDHWSVGSWMCLLMGAGRADRLRLVGATDDEMRAVPLTDDLQPAPDAGVKVTPAVVHKQLRRLAGIETGPIVDQFPIEAPELPIFG